MDLFKKCEIQPTLINLHPNASCQNLHYYPFAVQLDRCVERCNTLNDLSNKVYVPNKTEDLNTHIFNTITGKNDSKIWTKVILCEYKCKFDGRKWNSDQWCNNNKSHCECKKRHICEKEYICNPLKTSFLQKNGLSVFGDNNS